MNEAKEYLKRIRYYDAMIDSKLEELVMLKAKATRITPVMHDTGGIGSGSQDRLGNAVAKIVDLEKEIDNDVDSLVDLKREASSMLRKIDKTAYYNVLHKRYVQYETFEKIAIDMGYTYRNVLYLHGRALQEFQKIMDKQK